MFQLDKVQKIDLQELLQVTEEAKSQGKRFVTINCVDLGEELDLLYHFDKDLVVYSYRLTVNKGVEVPSISNIYISGLLIENELQDMYGLKFEGLVLDYHQKLLTVEEISQPLTVSNLGVQYVTKSNKKEVVTVGS